MKRSKFENLVQTGPKSTRNDNINESFVLGTVHEREVQLWFQCFCKENENLRNEENRVDNDQFRAIIKADPRITIRVIGNEFTVNHSTNVRHLEPIEKNKRSINGFLMS